MPFYAIKGSPVNESPLGLFDAGRGRPDCSRTSTASRAATSTSILSPWAVKRLDEYGGDITQVPRRQAASPSMLEADRHLQDRAGRREQPGHLARWSARSTSASSRHYAQDDPDAYSYSGGLCLRQPGPARVRRDVQGADQGAAPAADRHPGRQLQGHRRLRRDPVRRHRARALATRAEWKTFQQQQEQRGLPRPDLHRQGARTACASAKRSRSTRSCCATPRSPTRRARPGR